VGEIGFEWRKNDEIKKKMGTKIELGCFENEGTMFLFC